MDGKTFGVYSLIFSIAGFLLLLIVGPLFAAMPFIVALFSLLGIVFGVLTLVKGPQNAKVMGIIGIVLSVLPWILVLTVLTNLR